MPAALTGLGLDVLSLLALVGWLYRRRAAAPEMTMVFTTLNIGLFAAMVAIGEGDFKAGVGFGLFGLLSMVRLRSTAFTVKDVSYTFTALVLALVNALSGNHVWLAVVLDVVVLAAIWLVDDTRSRPSTASAASEVLLGRMAPLRDLEYRHMEAEVDYSRVYMAGHFPADIQAGALLGDMIGDYLLVTREGIDPRQL